VQPQRIILLGDNPGDLLALGVKPIGNDWLGEPYVYKSELDGIADIGFPHNLEKILELKPDLILQSGYGDAEDAATYDAMTKIAPTALFNRGAPMEERIRQIADIIGNKQAAEDWLTQYESKAKSMWEKLGLNDGDTATVYLSLAGDYYVMGKFSLTMSLYRPEGFTPPAKVQKLIDQGELFAPISAEVLPEFAGDYIFMLSKPGTDDEKAAKELMASPLWSSLPAVKNGRAYVGDIGWNASDPITMERFLDELPKWLGK
jgi:iron complex transport system substrate-binding protein